MIRLVLLEHLKSAPEAPVSSLAALPLGASTRSVLAQDNQILEESSDWESSCPKISLSIDSVSLQTGIHRQLVADWLYTCWVTGDKTAVSSRAITSSTWSEKLAKNRCILLECAAFIKHQMYATPPMNITSMTVREHLVQTCIRYHHHCRSCLRVPYLDEYSEELCTIFWGLPFQR